MDFLIFLNKNIRMGYTPAAGKEKEDKQTYSAERQRGIKGTFGWGLIHRKITKICSHLKFFME